jgi:hypothetical protein
MLRVAMLQAKSSQSDATTPEDGSESDADEAKD